eukprot:764850-Hanusia_phi.AAC.9
MNSCSCSNNTTKAVEQHNRSCYNRCNLSSRSRFSKALVRSAAPDSADTTTQVAISPMSSSPSSPMYSKISPRSPAPRCQVASLTDMRRHCSRPAL